MTKRRPGLEFCAWLGPAWWFGTRPGTGFEILKSEVTAYPIFSDGDRQKLTGTGKMKVSSNFQLYLTNKHIWLTGEMKSCTNGARIKGIQQN